MPVPRIRPSAPIVVTFPSPTPVWYCTMPLIARNTLRATNMQTKPRTRSGVVDCQADQEVAKDDGSEIEQALVRAAKPSPRRVRHHDRKPEQQHVTVDCRTDQRSWTDKQRADHDQARSRLTARPRPERPPATARSRPVGCRSRRRKQLPKDTARSIRSRRVPARTSIRLTAACRPGGAYRSSRLRLDRTVQRAVSPSTCREG